MFLRWKRRRRNYNANETFERFCILRMMFYWIIYRNFPYNVGFGIINISFCFTAYSHNMPSKPCHSINLSRFLSGQSLHDTRMRFVSKKNVCVLVNLPIFLFQLATKMWKAKARKLNQQELQKFLPSSIEYYLVINYFSPRKLCAGKQ